MKSEEVINEKILKITAVIHDNYPELSKYLNELPVTIPNEENPKLNLQSLELYYESLVYLLRNYVTEHQLNYTNQHKNTGHL